MCIIVVKPKKIKVDEEFVGVMERCFLNNPDGFGYMYPVEDKIRIKKGYMKWNNAEKELRALIGKDMPLVLHFRVATHGKIDRFTCHPFPLSKKVSGLRSVRTTAKVGIAHNGVVSFCCAKKGNLSDTQRFIKDYLSRIPTDMLREKYMHKLIDKATGSKFAIMFPDEIYLVGDFIKDGGIYYSNGTYKTGRKVYSYAYTNWYYGATSKEVERLNYPCDYCGAYAASHEVIDYVEGIDMVLCDQCYKEFFFTCSICKEVLPTEYESKTKGVCIKCKDGARWWE